MFLFFIFLFFYLIVAYISALVKNPARGFHGIKKAKTDVCLILSALTVLTVFGFIYAFCNFFILFNGNFVKFFTCSTVIPASIIFLAISNAFFSSSFLAFSSVFFSF